MTTEEFYGDYYPGMKRVEKTLLDMIEKYQESCKDEEIRAIIYSSSRIKSADSMTKKLEMRDLKVDAATAMTELYDAIGVRIVCAFVEDVFAVAEWLKQRPELEIVKIKDYISYPKPNGYRSLHMQVRVNGLPAEIQLRTIGIDFWATLEHQMKYKHDVPHEALLREELKRCADEIVSVDLSMQTIRELIQEGF
ncbi:MAG: RelA/SpoT domain protein [Clostridiales bacterium]|nr:RelA/SpoT domain protein [Clostridiales bacterium]